MRTATLIARDIVVIAIWFAVMLACSVGLAVRFDAVIAPPGLGPLASTLATMTLSIVVASAVAALAWRGLSRALQRRLAKPSPEAAGTEASFANIA